MHHNPKVTAPPSTAVGGEDEVVVKREHPEASVEGLNAEEDFAATDDVRDDDFQVEEFSVHRKMWSVKKCFKEDQTTSFRNLYRSHM